MKFVFQILDLDFNGLLGGVDLLEVQKIIE